MSTALLQVQSILSSAVLLHNKSLLSLGRRRFASAQAKASKYDLQAEQTQQDQSERTQDQSVDQSAVGTSPRRSSGAPVVKLTGLDGFPPSLTAGAGLHIW